LLGELSLKRLISSELSSYCDQGEVATLLPNWHVGVGNRPRPNSCPRPPFAQFTILQEFLFDEVDHAAADLAVSAGNPFVEGFHLEDDLAREFEGALARWVRRKPLGSGSKSRWPWRSSRRRIRQETVEWFTPSRSPARRIKPVSATARKKRASPH
jgi:hypothetical protein